MTMVSETINMGASLGWTEDIKWEIMVMEDLTTT